MKKLLLILLCLPMIGFAQQTYVPDNGFESDLENLGLGNGIFNDDYVFTSAIDTVTYIDFSSFGIIYDLTGIEDFTALTHLNCSGWFQLSSLDVSSNTNLVSLNCGGNQLTSLDITQNTALKSLYCSHNQLTSLDVTQNTLLEIFFCNMNQINSLNVSQNTLLYEFDLRNNQLTELDVRNGMNLNWGLDFNCTGNPNLTCINVDDSTWSANNWTVANGLIDPQHYFSITVHLHQYKNILPTKNFLN